METLSSEVEPFFRPLFKNQYAISKAWIGFKKKRPDLAALYTKIIPPFSRPFFPLSYPFSAPLLNLETAVGPSQKVQDFESESLARGADIPQVVKAAPRASDSDSKDCTFWPASTAVSRLNLTDETPVIFLEPLDLDLVALGQQLHDKPAIFVVETRVALAHILQLPGAEELFHPGHLLYILELYPHQQLALQAYQGFKNRPLQPHFLSKNKLIEDFAPPLLQALAACLAEPELNSDTEAGNWLYQTAKQLLFSIREKRLGAKRAVGLKERQISNDWHDPHKGLPAKGRPLGPPPKDYFELKLKELAKTREKRKKRIRLVHVVPQIVDGGHAPSKLLESLVRHHDSERFEIIIISTERLQLHYMDYPYPFYGSMSSLLRGKERINYFQSRGLIVRVLDNRFSYEQSAHLVTQFLHEVLADVAIFHGPDTLNCMVAQETDVPTRVLFEHGTPPAYPGFDLMIASTPVGPEFKRELCPKIEVLPFRIDVRSEWKPEPPAKEGLIMTTISNHLASRLSPDMCWAIAEILKQVPKAHYHPIGPIYPPQIQKFMAYFKEQGVATE